MAETNRKHASRRMKDRNPMHNAETRAKVAAKLRAKGWRPPVHLGNGSTTEPQRLLACALGWDMEVVVNTGEPRGGEYPQGYKVDVGNVALKIAVEVDGNSHRMLARKAEDAKKTAKLESLGWKVLRFLNREVMDDLAACVRTVLSTM